MRSRLSSAGGPSSLPLSTPTTTMDSTLTCGPSPALSAPWRSVAFHRLSASSSASRFFISSTLFLAGPESERTRAWSAKRPLLPQSTVSGGLQAIELDVMTALVAESCASEKKCYTHTPLIRELTLPDLTSTNHARLRAARGGGTIWH